MHKALNSAIFCILASFLATMAMGQELETPKESPYNENSYDRFLWGFRAGINATTPHFEDADARKALGAETSIGWTIGAVGQFKLTNRWAFQSELGYSKKVSSFSFDTDGSVNRMSMDFIDISLLLRRRFWFSWGKDIRSDVFVGIGPNINYMLGASGTSIAVDGQSYPYNIVIDGTPDANFNNLYLNGVNRWLFGIDIGVGINAPISPKQKVFVEFRASLGQTNLGSESSSVYINQAGFNGSMFQQNLLKSNLKTFSITAAYTFTFNYAKSHMGKSTKDSMVKKRKPKRRKR